MAEYFDQVNPLVIHRSAALDIDPFDRAVANANDEHPLGRLHTGSGAYPGSILARHCARCYDSGVMYSEIVHKLTDLDAIAAANLFLSDHMPDNYCAGYPTYDDAARL